MVQSACWNAERGVIDNSQVSGTAALGDRERLFWFSSIVIDQHAAFFIQRLAMQVGLPAEGGIARRAVNSANARTC